jgi:hypothetical protein
MYSTLLPLLLLGHYHACLSHKLRLNSIAGHRHSGIQYLRPLLQNSCTGLCPLILALDWFRHRHICHSSTGLAGCRRVRKKSARRGEGRLNRRLVIIPQLLSHLGTAMRVREYRLPFPLSIKCNVLCKSLLGQSKYSLRNTKDKRVVCNLNSVQYISAFWSKYPGDDDSSIVICVSLNSLCAHPTKYAKSHEQ